MREDPNATPSFPPELEVRLVALILGESSDFERAELERMMAERPELSDWFHRLREAHDTLGEASLAKVCPGGNFKLGERRLRAVYKHIGQVAIPQKPALGKDAGHWQRGIVWSLGAIVGALAISIAMSALFLSMGEPRGGAGLRTVFAPKEQTEREAANDSEMPLDEGGAPTTNAPVVESGKRISKAQSSNGPSVYFNSNIGNGINRGWIGDLGSPDTGRQSLIFGETSDAEVLPQGDLRRFDLAFRSSPRFVDSAKALAKNDAFSNNRLPTLSLAASEQPFSTFSLNVSDVSFLIARKALMEHNIMPPPDQVRVEDFVNAFNYGDPLPDVEERVTCAIEQSAHPSGQQRNLVRIGIRTAATGRDQRQSLQLTILLDNSGSMEREDRKEAVSMAMSALVSHLNPIDRVSLVSFSREPQLRIESLPGNSNRQLIEELERMPTEGGTNLEAALKLAAEVALRGLKSAESAEMSLRSGLNRIVLITDGAANLGDANPGRLRKFVSGLRMRGLALDVCGVGISGLDDVLLRSLTHESDGRYYALNSAADAEASFVAQLAGALHPVARNAKVQVRFNPNRVGGYRLMGYDAHRLKKEDFHNDGVDAAELSAAEAGVALYEVEVLAGGRGDLGQVFVRFQDVATGEMIERRWIMPYDAAAAPFDKATPSLQLAGTAAFLAEHLQYPSLGIQPPLESLSPVLNQLRFQYSDQLRVQDLIRMVESVR